MLKELKSVHIKVETKLLENPVNDPILGNAFDNVVNEHEWIENLTPEQVKKFKEEELKLRGDLTFKEKMLECYWLIMKKICPKVYFRAARKHSLVRGLSPDNLGIWAYTGLTEARNNIIQKANSLWARSTLKDNEEYDNGKF